jgi:hypothetical protein
VSNRSKWHTYSIASSASTRTVDGTWQRAKKRPASRMAAGSCAQIEILPRAYEHPALRKPFAAFPADTKRIGITSE